MKELSAFAGWDSFYVIVGSSAAALTGLQFVVITLVAEVRRRDSSTATIDAFGTPTIVHFCASLMIAAVLSAPWERLVSAGVALGVTGVVGLVYGVLVVRRARRQQGYRPVLEDWIWHAVLPILSYATIVLSATLLERDTRGASFFIAAAALLLLFIGIHNAWDTVTYIAITAPETTSDGERSEPAAAAPTRGS
jgi:hypothetical protein